MTPKPEELVKFCDRHNQPLAWRTMTINGHETHGRVCDACTREALDKAWRDGLTLGRLDRFNKRHGRAKRLQGVRK